MQVKITRYPTGVPIRYFEVDAITCDIFWRNLKKPKIMFIRDINKTILKPANYLAFTFIGYDITYSVNQMTKIVEKMTITENVIIYLPKWNQYRKNSSRIQKRFFSFLKKALYHEYKYHVYLYEERQLHYLYNVLKNLEKPTLTRVAKTIKNFQRMLIQEQELSHVSAPRGKSFCLRNTNSFQYLKNRKIN